MKKAFAQSKEQAAAYRQGYKDGEDNVKRKLRFLLDVYSTHEVQNLDNDD